MTRFEKEIEEIDGKIAELRNRRNMIMRLWRESNSFEEDETVQVSGVPYPVEKEAFRR